MSEHEGNVVDIGPYLDRREQQQAWQQLAERIGSDERAVNRLRSLMEHYVGHPDPEQRIREGLPQVTDDRMGDMVFYPTEICSLLDDKGNFTHVREIDPSQRWMENITHSYSHSQILERGKNYFVIAGNLFADEEPQKQVVGQCSSSEAGASIRLQVLRPDSLYGPYVPIEGTTMTVDHPGRVEIRRGENGTTLRMLNEYEPRNTVAIDTAFIDMVADARSRNLDQHEAVSS